MIPPAREIVSSLRAAWRLLFLDAEAMAGFNLTMTGFWRSYFAAAFGLPYYAVMLWEPHAQGVIGLPAAIAAYVLSWVVFPVIAAVLAHILQLGRNYVGYIIAFNWVGALMPQPLLLLALLHRAGVLDENAYGMVALGLFIAFLWYGWAVTRIGLGAGVLTACGFVILSNLLDMLIRILLLDPQGGA